MDKLKLTELIDVSILQKLQDSFSKYTGLAALVTDDQSNLIPDETGMSDFCAQINRQSELGCQRCAECGKQSALATLENGKPVLYQCHLGLLEFAAPIMVGEKRLGNFVGGQVVDKPLDLEQVRQSARELGIEEEGFVEAARRLPVVDREQLERASEFLFELGEVLSEMAYKSSEELKKSRKLERAAKSQSSFIIDMNDEFQRNMSEWLGYARTAVNSGDAETMKKLMDELLRKGPALLSNFSDTVEYAKMTDGKIELNETEYNIDYLLSLICRNVESQIADKAVVIIRQVDDNVPAKLLGDQGRIGQVVSKLLMNSIQYTEEGIINIHVSSEPSGYAEYVTIEISDTGMGMLPEAVDAVNDYFQYKDTRVFDRKEGKEIGLSMISYLVRQMSGKVKVKSEVGKGTSFFISLPQLKLV